MKLKSITLNNFKGMDNIEFSLDQKTTVIFGINGVGKSTILKAIDLLYANIIAKLTKKKTTEFDKDDISYGKSKATIEAKFVFEDGEEIDFRNLFKWFRNQEDIENQAKVRNNNMGYEDRSLKVVKKAMLAMLDGFEDIHIERKSLSMKVTKNGRNFKINQLSDGEKCTISLFGDLARRMALANPGRENPLEGTGVMLIDELELHMHTSWQRKVLGVLKETFPNIQFIITTHSPQILGELDDKYNLVYLKKEI